VTKVVTWLVPCTDSWANETAAIYRNYDAMYGKIVKHNETKRVAAHTTVIFPAVALYA